MDVKKAALACLPHIDRAVGLPPHNEEFGRDHLRWMVREVMEWDLSSPKMVQKAHRWLGYIQGCVVAGGGATLEDVKRINVEA